ncbi:hypothetical protein [Klebsiella spallanzanii]|uniref:Flagella biosynthesis regulator n=1 Tax=Klebsiella spallanzanii TaxID=2587528 RepID=A0A564MB91_9ENTR|nr:hypothetical protein [Klebsiella spallanzanii]VUS91205.1 hypothetical protein SB6408_05709 [Klebsiella spallanzanii]
MTVNSTGDQNRTSGRDFNENNIQIDKFDGRHTINIAIPSERQNERPLVKAQRKELNALVATICSTGGGEAYEIWQKVHAEIGVSSIDEMTANQYQTAISFLQAMLGKIKDFDSSKILVHLLLKNTENDVSRQKLISYCHINFGTGRLNDLTRPQLQQALQWVGDELSPPVNTSHPKRKNRFVILSVIKQAPKESFLVFILGFSVGAILSLFILHFN